MSLPPPSSSPSPRLRSLEETLPEIRGLLQAFGYLGIIVLDFEPLQSIEAECGSDRYNQLLGRIATGVLGMRAKQVREGDLICSLRPFGEQLGIFLDGARHPRSLDQMELEQVA